ncbi:MAG: PorP/SprF family type IX secretion system membrane protein [Bacteroidales bacterium]|nr:PorP/SprF family type IX secretion system membrane protein [Bacteroidales bacterium]
MRRRRLITLMLLASTLLHAQDIHFSMLDLDPLLFNPAYSGFFEGEARYGVIYRNQWATVSAPFQTISATAEWNLARSRRSHNGWNLGLWASRDRAGTLGYGTTSASAIVSYFQRVANDNNLISLGAEVGIGQSGFNPDDILLPQGAEPFTREKVLYPTLGAGAAWFYQVNDALYTKVGASVRNINQPNISYLGMDETRLSRRYNVYGRAEWRGWPRVSLMPVVGFQLQKRFSELVYGCDVKWYLNERPRHYLALIGGVVARHGDAASINMAVEWQAWTFAFSYDANLSQLAQASHTLGAFEVGIIYKLTKQDRRHSALPCPII